jgi:2-keto-4-pentenoate hydratase/2-oxohepta-3-ene-1,7-dioic acid hydratase in catechol pathway
MLRAARRLIRFRHPSTSQTTLALHQHESDPSCTPVEGDVFCPDSLTPTGETILLKDIDHLLAPITPPLIIGTGLNYHKHAVECNLPPPDYPILAFFKSRQSIQHPGLPITIPSCCTDEIDWEVELAVVLKKDCKNCTLDNAMSHVLGYTVANDISARNWQTTTHAGQWNFGKGMDHFCPLGPAMVLHEDTSSFDPHDLDIVLRVNGETKQKSRTNDMIHQIPAILVSLSKGTTLEKGTVVLTGTPEGIGHFADPPTYLQVGDVVTATIEDIGTLENTIVAEKEWKVET